MERVCPVLLRICALIFAFSFVFSQKESARKTAYSKHNYLKRSLKRVNLTKLSKTPLTKFLHERQDKTKHKLESVIGGLKNINQPMSVNNTIDEGSAHAKDKWILDNFYWNDTNIGNRTLHKTCGRCSLRESVKNLRIDWLKSHILDSLNLVEPPNVTDLIIPDPSAVEQMVKKLYRKRIRHNRKFRAYEDEETPEKVVILMAKGVSGKRITQPTIKRKNVAYYHVAGGLDYGRITRATLFVLVKPPHNKSLIRRMVINVHILTKTKIMIFRSYLGNHNLTSSEKKRLRAGNNSWVAINVTNSVIDFTHRGDNEIGFNAVAAKFSTETGDRSTELDLIHGINTEASAVQLGPFLKIHFDLPHTRQKRSTDKETCTENDDEKNCCRYPLLADFNDFKWDFIIAPKKIETYYCEGDCPYHRKTGTMHAHIARQNKREATPCCVPHKFKSEMLLHFDANKDIQLSKVNNVIALTCACM